MNKFNIGEIVIRQAPSTNYPEFNGEYKILDIVTGEQFSENYPNYRVASNYYYQLEGFLVPLVSGLICSYSAEAFLRKKHDGSSFSFSQLMSSLKQPSLIDN